MRPFKTSFGKTVAGGGSREVVMSVARSRKRAVCLRAGRGVVGRMPAVKVWSQAGAGWRCRDWRCAESSATSVFAMLRAGDIQGSILGRESARIGRIVELLRSRCDVDLKNA